MDQAADPRIDYPSLIDIQPAPPPRLDPPVTDQAPRPSRAGGRGLAGLLAAGSDLAHVSASA